MKKALNGLLEAIGTIIGTVIALFLALVLILLVPFDYIRYKRSPYYKIERRKYRLFAGNSDYFGLYNDIVKNNLPIKYIHNPKEERVVHGWFVFDRTLIISNVFSFEYNEEFDRWDYYCEICDDDGNEKTTVITLDEYISTEIEEANRLSGQNICDKAIVLIDGALFKEKERAMQEKRFLVYDDRIDALKKFCVADGSE